MLKKIRFILALISLSVCLCLMSSTYSRYVATSTGNIDALFAKWQILVNDIDITNGSGSTITFTPTIEENEYVAENVMAPASKGHFDIEIDPTNVEVSFSYFIALGIENEAMPDLTITGYAILPEDYVEGHPLDVISIEGNTITNVLNFDNEIEAFQFETFTIRVFFEWYEGEDELMTDEDDTEVGLLAATEEITFAMNANISFEQIIE